MTNLKPNQTTIIMLNPSLTPRRKNLYERLTPEALERLNAISNKRMRNSLIDILKAEEFWTRLRVGDMHTVLVWLGYEVTYLNMVSIFNDSK
jgi:hypothetical protein